jgi:hypothetical protein
LLLLCLSQHLPNGEAATLTTAVILTIVVTAAMTIAGFAIPSIDWIA